jgi:hypothetical protein
MGEQLLDHYAEDKHEKVLTEAGLNKQFDNLISNAHFLPNLYMYLYALDVQLYLLHCANVIGQV